MQLDDHYYSMLHVRLNERVFFDSDQVTVDLFGIQESEIVCNDVDRNRRLSSDSFFYVSGGGSFLVNGRYLLVVKRDALALVNPGKISLFTGRSNNYHEWLDPTLCVRELFEELTLFSDGNLLLLKNDQFQTIIDATYALSHRSESDVAIEARLISQPNSQLNVYSESGNHHHQVLMVVNESNDINCLFIFEISIPLKGLTVIDSEDNGSDRKVYLLDIKDLKINELLKSEFDHWDPITASELTTNLSAILSQLT
jgi:hypothetical protein